MSVPPGKFETIALSYLLSKLEDRQYISVPVCCGEDYCCFSIPSYLRDTRFERPNPMDNGEGYYDCSLTGKQGFWGEKPICSILDWVQLAKKELLALGIEIEPTKLLNY